MKAEFLCGICTALLVAASCNASAEQGVEAVPSVQPIAADYPLRALREGRQGTVTILLTVGPDGRPKSCAIASSSGHTDLDHAACTSAMRATGFPPVADGGDRKFIQKAEFRIEE
jgi:TonB family protein